MDKPADHRPTTETDRPNISTEHQGQGDARRPSDTLDRGRETNETVPRKSALIDDASGEDGE